MSNHIMPLSRINYRNYDGFSIDAIARNAILLIAGISLL